MYKTGFYKLQLVRIQAFSKLQALQNSENISSERDSLTMEKKVQLILRGNRFIRKKFIWTVTCRDFLRLINIDTFQQLSRQMWLSPVTQAPGRQELRDGYCLAQRKASTQQGYKSLPWKTQIWTRFSRPFPGN